MEDKEELEKNALKGSATGVNLKYASSKTDDLSQRPALAVQASFSYIASSQNVSKPSTMAVDGTPQRQERCRNSAASQQDGAPMPQRMDGFSSSHYKISTLAGGKTRNYVDKQGLNDWLVLGKRLQQHPPDYWSPRQAFRRRSSSEPTRSLDRYLQSQGSCSAGLHTYPPTASRLRPASEMNPKQQGPECGNFFNTNRHRLPAFNPRPLGQAWVGYERQRLRHRELERPLDDILASGERHLMSVRSGPPRRCSPTPHLQRVSSQESLRNHASRSRSASLPTQSKLHDARVVMEWRERRTGGVTYVTPFLQNLSDAQKVLEDASQATSNLNEGPAQHDCSELS